MNNLAKLGLAIVLALVAAGLNMLYLASKAKPTEYLALSDEAEDIPAGTPFPDNESIYKAIPIVGTPELLETLIPYDQGKGKSLVVGTRASRDIAKGDPIFFRDIAEDVPRYERLGPFTLLSVGEYLTGNIDTEQSDSGGTAITVESATDEFDMDTRRLLQIIEAQKQRDMAASHLRIVAIEAYPSSNSADSPGDDGAALGDQASSRELIREKKRAIIVPLDDVANIPKVLQIGTQVGFIVPAYP